MQLIANRSATPRAGRRLQEGFIRRLCLQLLANDGIQ